MMFLIFVNFVLLSMMQAEGGKLLPTICKQFPDADICSGTDQPAVEQVVDDLFSAITQEDDVIVSAIVPFFASAIANETEFLAWAGVQEMDEIVSAMEYMGDFFVSAMQQEEDDLISAIKQEGKKEPKQAERELLHTDINLTSGLKRKMERGGNQMERQEALTISKRHPGAAWEAEEKRCGYDDTGAFYCGLE